MTRLRMPDGPGLIVNRQRAKAWVLIALGAVLMVCLILLMPDDPGWWFLLGLFIGLAGILGSWQATKWAGCRRCKLEDWP